MSLPSGTSPWLTSKEESFLFDELLVHSRFNDLGDTDQETGSEEKTQTTEEVSVNEQIGLSALEHCGLVEIDPSEFTKKAIEQWTKDLLSYCHVDSSPYESLVQKRLAVQKFLHATQRKALSLYKNSKSSNIPDISTSNIPVVVRLSVLTLFPIVESLSSIPDANYQKLCSQILDVVINIIQSVGTLALRQEPADCLDAFKLFVSKLLDSYEYKIDSDQKARAAVALVGLAISRGGA
eukprot:TRINITY_DN8359_c0_g1_i1.p1 TRINITY_DN8359_c0_g1~~TRINITY_DN8359_c0_g1_i1.p1  ORF type:complete len:237 (-),score=33.93 TRINITY_DN8359_c0_g1_i1:151-861(-)